MQTLHSQVLSLWAPILKNALAGKPIAADIAVIENLMQVASAASDDYGRNTDIERDLNFAREIHTYNKARVEDNTKTFLEWRAFWKERAEVTEKFAVSLAQEGLKYSLVLHGAAAVSFLNAIASEKLTHLKGVLQFGLCSSAAGVVTTALAHIIIINFLSHISAKVMGQVISSKGWSQLVAIGRWLNLPQFERIKLAMNVLIFISIAWFGIYILIVASLI